MFNSKTKKYATSKLAVVSQTVRNSSFLQKNVQPILQKIWLSLNVTFYFPPIVYLVQVMNFKFLFGKFIANVPKFDICNS